MHGFVGEVCGYLGQVAARVSVMVTIGAFWQIVREEEGKSREDVASALGRSTDDIALFEHGLLPNEDLPEQFIIQLAHFLGRMDALDVHIGQYESEYLRQALKKIEEEERGEEPEEDT